MSLKVAHETAPALAESSATLAGALEMAALGFAVFPLKPGTKDGFLSESWKAQATTDTGRIQALAAKHPGCNWGARCSGHMVLDADVTNGKQGEASLLVVDLEHGLPVTRTHRSARGGLHMFLRMPAGLEASNRSAPLGDGIDVRGSGGFVLCPGSTFDGHPYTVESAAPVAEAPASLVALLRAPDAAKGREVPPEHMDHPAAIAGALDWLQRRPVASKGERGSSVFKAAARLRDWGLSHDVALELIGDHYAPNMDPPADTAFCRHEVRSAYTYAQNTAGVKSVTVDFDDVSALAEELAPAADAPPIAKGEQLRWPAVDADGKQLPNRVENLQALLAHLGISVWRNEFSEDDHIIGGGFDARPITDDTVKVLYTICQKHKLKITRADLESHLTVAALSVRRHPVREYLAGLQWDGSPRVASWLSRYLGAGDTPLHREFGRLWLAAAVHRVRDPGCKFDNMLVLEGAQGAGKSTALKILAGQWFEDNLPLSATSKEVIEQTAGKWIIEVPELSGMANKEAEHVKALLSRTTDRARRAYAKRPVDVPRQFVLAGTTNDDRYLRDRTGNRRYWPVAVGKIDLAALARDRDQLWAEAAVIETAEAGKDPTDRLKLPGGLWTVAAAAQAEREIIDPIREALEPTYGTGTGWGYVIPPKLHSLLNWDNAEGGRGVKLKTAMEKMGWAYHQKKRIGTYNGACYVRMPEGANAEPMEFRPGAPTSRLALAFDQDAELATAICYVNEIQ